MFGKAMSLPVLYRPEIFDEVIGQPGLVSRLRRRIDEGAGGALLFSGPIGCGKTTMARITAMALLCKAPLRGDPCRHCVACRQFKAGQNWIELNGKHATAAELRGAVEALRHASLHANRVLVFVDEIHELHPQSKRTLHSALEDLPPRAVLMACTWAPERLDADLRQRFIEFRVAPITRELLTAHAETVCCAENIDFEADALALLVDHAEGSARGLLKVIEDVGSPLTATRVRQGLRLDFSEALEHYVAELVRGGALAEQTKALEFWLSSAEERRALLERFFGFAFRHKVIGLPVLDDVLMRFPDALLGQLAFVVQAAAAASAEPRTTNEVWESLIYRSASGGVPVTAANLDARLSAIDRIVSAGRDVPQVTVVTPKRIGIRPRRRRLWKGAEAGPQQFLDRDQAFELWDSASFLAQEHGRLLNGSLRLLASSPGQAVSAADFGQVANRLSTHLARRGSMLHWLWVQSDEIDRVGITLALSVEPEFCSEANRWLGNAAGRFADRGLTLTVERPLFSRISFQRHLDILRGLSLGLHPGLLEMVGSEARPLFELLGLQPSSLHSMGHGRRQQIWGRSHSLSNAARAGVWPILSAVRDGAWGWAGSGWEMEEHKDRRSAQRAWAHEVEELERLATQSLFGIELTPIIPPLDWPRSWLAWKNSNKYK